MHADSMTRNGCYEGEIGLRAQALRRVSTIINDRGRLRSKLDHVDVKGNNLRIGGSLTDLFSE
jgi:hypothetical protein